MAKSKASGSFGVEEILLDHSPEVRALVQSVRNIIRDVVPEASEAAHPVWHSINYRHPESGYFCGIFPEQVSVKLAFEFGVLLPDPENQLEGSGKQVRYLNLQDGDKLPEQALKELILAALALPPRREDKLALIRSGARPAW